MERFWAVELTHRYVMLAMKPRQKLEEAGLAGEDHWSGEGGLRSEHIDQIAEELAEADVDN